MTDPAVEADKRAVNLMNQMHDQYEWVNYGEVAAREALSPIREWYDRNYGMSSITDHLLDDLAPLIFTTEELER
ncbi:hypothetical protein MABM_17440 [Mycobacteroides abscessus]|uniref:Uncharacterized protein n=1 Tax=Mycobacteroides abscessus subsp. bolletii 50594 TaxID=1303024 RepID=A0AB33A8U5_9MYCO|nr:hypothetical protein [Mycobacteroides abscessus]AGM28152.1 hypothetical protein MASS_1550 [Mycobacteroides abscessus subsp. bolletii 50594]BBZ81828.1 hypothetical protein MABM_17440 [Mycobacteroides abscessus]